jgi:hypothetical protein
LAGNLSFRTSPLKEDVSEAKQNRVFLNSHNIDTIACYIVVRKERRTMDFLLSHWHCIVPVLAIAVVLLLQNRGRKNDTEK